MANLSTLLVSTYRMPHTVRAAVLHAASGRTALAWTIEPPWRACLRETSLPLTVGVCYKWPKTHVTIRYNLGPHLRLRPAHVRTDSLSGVLASAVNK